jgi:hypothetical protein
MLEAFVAIISATDWEVRRTAEAFVAIISATDW